MVPGHELRSTAAVTLTPKAAVRDVDVYIEQPCLSYEECLSVRRHTDHPFVLDENVDNLDMLLRVKADLEQPAQRGSR